MTGNDLRRILDALPRYMLDLPVTFAANGEESSVAVLVVITECVVKGEVPRVMLLSEFAAPETYSQPAFLAAFTRRPFSNVSTPDGRDKSG